MNAFKRREKMKADVLALARLIRYSKEEALRLGMSAVAVECLRMAGIELTHTIEKGRPGRKRRGGGGADELSAKRGGFAGARS
jgi:hypothetical protein